MKTTIPDEMISLAKSDVHRIYQRVNNYKVNADNHKAERGLGRALTILSIFGFIFCVFTNDKSAAERLVSHLKLEFAARQNLFKLRQSQR